jgi:hypothetical protein
MTDESLGLQTLNFMKSLKLLPHRPEKMWWPDETAYLR